MERDISKDIVNEMEQDTRVTVIMPQLPVAGENQTFTGRLSLPYLKIAYGVGGLAEAGFSPGELVLQRTSNSEGHSIYQPQRTAKDKPQEPLRIVVLSFAEYYKEYLNQAKFEEYRDSGKSPQVFRTAKEAITAGFTVERDPFTGRLPTAPPAMNWLTLIEKPADLVSEYFCLTTLDRVFAPAYFILEKSAYLSVRDNFGQAARYTAKTRGISSVQWKLWTAMRKAKTGNVTWVPKIAKDRDLTPGEVTQMLVDLKGESARA